MQIETMNQASGEELRINLLPRLRGHVFHVTNATAYAGIRRSAAIVPNETRRFAFSSPSSARSFGRTRGYICLMDLRCASDEMVDDALDCFYFLDPFVRSRINVFLLLHPEAYGELIPNAVGREYSPKAMVIPHVEVWYPGRLPLKKIDVVVRCPIARPGKWDFMDRGVLRQIARGRRP